LNGFSRAKNELFRGGLMVAHDARTATLVWC
jgi:hypothetical protein